MTAKHVVIVGASRLGCDIALRAKKAGCQVTLVDEHPQQLKSMSLDAPYFYGSGLSAGLSDEAAVLDNVLGSDELLMECLEQEVDLRISTVAWGAFHNAPNRQHIGTPKVALVNAEGNELLDYDSLVLAPGMRDFVPSFKGWELPGVFGVKAGSALVGRYRVFNSTRVLILGSTDLAVEFARLARECGVEVAGLVEPTDRCACSPDQVGWLSSENIPVFLDSVILSAEGVDGVRGARLLGKEGVETQVACDGICVAIATLPNIELPAAMGCELEFRDDLGAWVPKVSKAMETSVAYVYWASETDRLADPAERIISAILGESASLTDLPERASEKQEAAGQAALWTQRLHETGGMDVVLCQCETVTRGDFLEVRPPRYLGADLRAPKSHVMSEGETATANQDLAKRMTRVGMGHCQGKRCRDEAALVLAQRYGIPLRNIKPGSYRFPVRPIDMELMTAPDGDAYTSGLFQNWPEPAELRASGGGGHA